MNESLEASAANNAKGTVLKDRDPRSFDHLAEEYDFAASLERRPDFFLSHLPQRRCRVLDVGCGTGILAKELARHFQTVVAIDISEPMLAIARGKRAAANIEYRRTDADQLVLEEKFDAIVSHTTFHHLEDVPRTLSVLKTALEPDGRLILVDNVVRWPFLDRHTPLRNALSCLRFPPDALRHGLLPAWRLFRFRVSRSWLAHMATDRFLSADEFRNTYGQLLPGASFTRLKYFMGVVWQVPGPNAA
ncbi:MAG TPA: methyltransferase domain-containing protein [Verrucomicrobiae bacterium]|nr:methyltransferase domain-containing protein [Verrucomicrobiae bacterium]